MNEREKWEQFDLAKARLHRLASYYSSVIDEEERKAIPDMVQITQWGNERRSLMALSKVLDVEDQAGIANINSTYAPVLQALRPKQ